MTKIKSTLFSGKHYNLYKTRFTDWFNYFLNSTDQKLRTGYLFEQVTHKLYSKKQDICKVLDIGTGEGTLAKKIAEGLKIHCNSLYYYGLEQVETYAKRANATLSKLNITSVNIYQGNFSHQEDLAKLPNDADIILASHVAYYANNITEFVCDLINKAKNTTNFLFFHQSEHSKVSKWREKYGKHASYTGQEIKETFKANGFNVLEFFYPAIVKFPKHITTQDLLSKYTAILRQDFTPNMLKMANLLEFEVHAPLEYLESIGTLEDYLYDVTKVLHTQDNNLIIWDVLQVATKVKIENTTTLQNTIETDAIPAPILNIPESDIHEPNQNVEIARQVGDITIGSLKPLEMACYEGNIALVSKLWPQLTSHYFEERPFIGLNLASRNGHVNVIKYLLERKESFDLNIKSGDEGFTPLHLAVYSRHPYIVERLLDAGANMHAKDANGFSALYLACGYQQLRTAQILLDHNNLRNVRKIGIAEVQSLITLMEENAHATMYSILDTLYTKYSEMKHYCDLQKAKVLYDHNREYITQHYSNIIARLTRLFASNKCETHENATEVVNAHKSQLERESGLQSQHKTLLESNLVLHKDYFIERQTLNQSLYSAMSDFEIYGRVVVSGVLGVGKTTFAKAVALEWSKELNNRRIVWLELDYKVGFHNGIASLFKMLGIEGAIANKEIKSFTQKELEEIAKKLKNSSNEYMFIFDNYFDYISLKTVDQQDIELGIPCDVVAKMANQLLERLQRIGNIRILITARSAPALPLFKVKRLEPFKTQDIARYFAAYGHNINGKDLLYIEETFGALPLQLAALHNSLSGTFHVVPFNYFIEARTKDPCAGIPTNRLEMLGKALNAQEQNFLMYMSYLGSNRIEFIESITYQKIESMNRLETFSLIEAHNGHCVIQQDISKLLRNYFRCVDQENFYKAIKVIGDGLMAKFAEGAAGEHILPHMGTINKFCTDAKEDLGNKNSFEDWCHTVPLSICRDQYELNHYMQCDDHNFFVNDVCYDLCSKDWTFEI